jgi:hypothetical protein
MEIPGTKAALSVGADFRAVKARNERRAMSLPDLLGRDPHAILEIDATPEKETAA